MQSNKPLDAINKVLHDDAPAILTRGYGFGAHIWKRVRVGARSAPMRLLGDDTIFVRGVEGVEGVEASTISTRSSVTGRCPAIVQETLFGHDSVHSLDGDAHRI